MNCGRKAAITSSVTDMAELSRRQFIQASSVAAAGLAAGTLAGTDAQAAPGGRKRRPNLLYVFSDQQSVDMLGCYGNESIQTPHLDAFAKTGVRFNHCISNSPVCTPHRGTLLSGLHPLHHGAFFNDLQMLPGKGKYFAEVLRDAGYRTGYVGKWHLYGGNRNRPVPKGPLRYGFDDYFLTNNCTLEFRAKKSWYWDHKNQRRLYEKWEPDAQTDQAITFLKQSAGKNRPWVLFVSWHPPHNWGGYWNYHAPKDAAKRYDPKAIKLRPTIPDTPGNRKMLRDYYALCSNLDDNFGRLLDTLKDTNALDNTVIVYSSDHGDCLRGEGRTNLHKCRPEADACRVPLLLRAPGLKPRGSDLLVSTLDLMPTILGLLGADVPGTCQGQNLAGAIRRGDDDVVDSIPLFMSRYDRVDWRGIYTKRFTYSFGPDGKRFNRLYDRETDPHEQRNLYADPAQRELREKLHARTLAWMKTFGDPNLPYAKMLQAVARQPAKDGRMARSRDGSLKGRPADLLSRKRQ